MKKSINKYIIIGVSLIGIFLFLLILLLTVDRQTNEEGMIGLYNFNKIFLVAGYKETWDGFSDVILYISLVFLLGLAVYGIYQLANKKSLFKVDKDILFIGIGVLIIFLFWILFDKLFIVNFRPILIQQVSEPSFPSTHVLLTTFIFLSSGYSITKRNSKKKIYTIISYIGFSSLILLCFLGRVLSSMHWMTDALGGLLLGAGLFFLVVGLDQAFLKKKMD